MILTSLDLLLTQACIAILHYFPISFTSGLQQPLRNPRSAVVVCPVLLILPGCNECHVLNVIFI
jgi:hypothetical protein